MTKRRSRGSSLVALLVGLAIGLVVLAAALAGLVRQAADSRRLLATARLDHDLQALSELAVRHLARAGHWAGAPQAVSRADSPGPHPVNPHRLSAQGPAHLDFSYDTSSEASSAPSTPPPPDAAHAYGLRLQDQHLQFRLGASGWQALHDGQALAITAFAVDVHPQDTPLGVPCHTPCPDPLPCAPRAQQLALHLRLTATAPRLPGWQRTLERHVVVRNPALLSACPA